MGAGSLKRDVVASQPDVSLSVAERDVLIMSTCSTVVPKLVAEDLPIFRSLIQGGFVRHAGSDEAASRGNVLSTVWCPLCVPSGVFPGCDVTALEEASLRARIAAICEQRMIVAAEEWTGKVLQLKQVRRATTPYGWFELT